MTFSVIKIIVASENVIHFYRKAYQKEIKIQSLTISGSKMAKSKSPEKPVKVKKAVVKKIADYFLRNGYLRLPSENKSKKKKVVSKKGYEIRFVAKDRKELSELKTVLKEAGLTAGKPFDKFNQFVLPVYGKDKYFRFKEMLAAEKIKISAHKK